ncbi:hypothetical protein Nepgr_015026 [Nepenthes gracilis]|uniref:Cation/H+ exchanger transmembrane domain-containing protein n=1 Tax=Nepenthes gracilis TaxID=150966 RepID=A0AAD3XR24_NEPGR|nr:hypothetical protein Nepgr_015026 [Nepenthes gracilis]
MVWLLKGTCTISPEFLSYGRILLSYTLAELFYWSGILTVFFCGIVTSHYTWQNETESSRVATKHVFTTLSFIAENFVVLYVGMDALDIKKWRFVGNSPGTSVALCSILLSLVMAGRVAFIFPISFLTNLAKKSPTEKINFRKQVSCLFSPFSAHQGRAYPAAGEYNHGHEYDIGCSFQHSGIWFVNKTSNKVSCCLLKHFPVRCIVSSSDLGSPMPRTLPLLDNQ